MSGKSQKLTRDQRLREIAYILARGVVRMKEDGELLISRWKEEKSVLQKPSTPVNQRVSG